MLKTLNDLYISTDFIFVFSLNMNIIFFPVLILFSATFVARHISIARIIYEKILFWFY